MLWRRIVTCAISMPQTCGAELQRLKRDTETGRSAAPPVLDQYPQCGKAGPHGEEESLEDRGSLSPVASRLIVEGGLYYRSHRAQAADR